MDLDPGRMTFKSLRIMVFSAFDVESILIAEMRRMDKANLAWNDSGFGSNDPGRKRDNGEPADFDRRYPINVDLPLDPMEAGTTTVGKLLKAARSSIPYILRYGRLSDYADSPVIISNKQPTMRNILMSVTDILPPDYQVTMFHGRVILYREITGYDYAVETIRGRG